MVRVPFFVVAAGILFSGADSLAATINVKDFGAKGDCQRVLDGAMAEGSPQLHSGAAQFQETDVGKDIAILNAGGSTYQGKPVLYGRLPLEATIVRVVDPHQVILSTPARHSVSGSTVTWGADDTEAIQKAIESAVTAGGGTVFFPAGMYRVTSHLSWGFGLGFQVDGSNIRLTGTGDTSKILNSSVHMFMSRGATFYHPTGASVVYVGGARPVSHVEIDHLWFGDNGEHFRYIMDGPTGPITNPEGPGVLGAFEVVHGLRLHDLTVVTSELCGINLDTRQADDIAMDHVEVQSNGGNHGLYLAGYKTHLTLTNSKITSHTTPMRLGVVVKGGSHIVIRHNTITNFVQQGIGLDANAQDQVVSDVTLSDNTIRNPPNMSLPTGAKQPGNTHGVQLNNGTRIVIQGNVITGMNYSGIYLGATLWPITNVHVEGNRIANTRFGILANANPARGATTPAAGLLRDLTVSGNVITDAVVGVEENQVAGQNVISGNCISSPASVCRLSFNLQALRAAKVTMTGNWASDCPAVNIPKELQSEPSNQLHASGSPCPGTTVP